MNNEKPNIDEECLQDKELQREYILIQLKLMSYMLKTGVIKTQQEYVIKIAPLFEMLSKAEIFVPERVDWNKLRNQVKDIQIGTNEKSSNQLP